MLTAISLAYNLVFKKNINENKDALVSFVLLKSFNQPLSVHFGMV